MTAPICDACADAGAVMELPCPIHGSGGVATATAGPESNGTERPGGLITGESDIDRFMGSLLTDEQLENLPPPEWLIDGLLVRNSIGVLYGASGGYKTFVALSWMLAVSTGSWWFGREVRQGPVLMVAAEGSVGLGRRIAAWKEHNRFYGGAGLLVRPEPVNLLDRAQVSVVATAAKQMGAVLVAVDTVARSMDGGDEDKARDMNVLVAGLDAIRRTSGACVLPIHHTGKDAERGLRGSSSLFAAASTVIECRGGEGRITLLHRKQKEDALAPDLHLGVQEVGESLVITNRPVEDEGVAQTARTMLAVLEEISDEDGVSSGIWLRACGQNRSGRIMAERTFRRYAKALVEDSYAAKIGKGPAARYMVTDQGKRLLEG
jgi:hypothetical protein